MKLRLAALLALTLLSACRHAGDVTADNGGGIYAVRSACPIAGVPAGTGDITLFNPAGSTDSRAIDVTAAITDVRAVCQDAGNDVVSTVTFTVVALRRDAGPARQVVFPISTSRCAAARGRGQAGRLARRSSSTRATSTPGPGSRRRSASIAAPPPCRRTSAQILTRPRKAGDAEAAIDPLSDPAIRKAVADATFEHLIGFQLTTDQLKYNATR